MSPGDSPRDGSASIRGNGVRASAATAVCLPARNWGWFALRGVLSILLGLAALLMPGPALFAFALVFAAYSLIDGVVTLISGIKGAGEGRERWWALVLSGLLGIAVGVLFFFFPVLGTVAYALTAVVLVAGWAISTGILEIAAAYRLRREIEREWLLMLDGGLSVLLGVLLIAILARAPIVTLLSVAWVIGIYALASGVLQLILAVRLRNHGRLSGVEGNSPVVTASK